MVRVLLGVPPVKPLFEEEGLPGNYTGLEWLQIGTLRIPVDDTASALVSRPQGQLQVFSHGR